jgi:hypothetical protein
MGPGPNERALLLAVEKSVTFLIFSLDEVDPIGNYKLIN